MKSIEELAREAGFHFHDLLSLPPIHRVEGPASAVEKLVELVRAESALEHLTANSEYLAHVGRLQAEIDRLMLEYCPEELTEEQWAEWLRHQQPVLYPLDDQGCDRN